MAKNLTNVRFSTRRLRIQNQFFSEPQLLRSKQKREENFTTNILSNNEPFLALQIIISIETGSLFHTCISTLLKKFVFYLYYCINKCISMKVRYIKTLTESVFFSYLKLFLRNCNLVAKYSIILYYIICYISTK